MSATANFIGTVRTPVVSIANADGTSFKSLMAAGSSGSRLDTLSVTNSDASNAYVVQLSVQVSAVDYVIGEVTVPAGSGTNGSAKAVNILNSTDLPQLANTLNVLFLASGATLRAKSKTAVSGVNTLHFVGAGGDY
jgi:hypothetical protein